MKPNLQEQLDEFLAGSENRKWLGWKSAQIYVRKSHRLLEGEMRSVLDVANLSIEPRDQGKGIFRDFIIHAELVNPYWGVYVENLLNKELEAKLLQHGYQIDKRSSMFEEIPNCVYKKR